MTFTIQEFLTLLKLDNKLKEEEKFLYIEDNEKFRKLLKYHVFIEGEIHRQKKQNYIELLENYLSKSINFNQLYLKLGQLNQNFQLENNSLIEELKNSDNSCNFVFINENYNFASLIGNVFSFIDQFDDEKKFADGPSFSESELRNYLLELLIKIQAC